MTAEQTCINGDARDVLGWGGLWGVDVSITYRMKEKRMKLPTESLKY